MYSSSTTDSRNAIGNVTMKGRVAIVSDISSLEIMAFTNVTTHTE
jgi:hypothetical protein